MVSRIFMFIAGTCFTLVVVTAFGIFIWLYWTSDAIPMLIKPLPIVAVFAIVSLVIAMIFE